MILYHYDISPYSEKIRLMLGYSGLEWQSMKVPPMPPRKSLDPMLGGYRRIPVAQVGADFFCDTRLITQEIADLSRQPELSFSCPDKEARAFAEYLIDHVFMPIVQTAKPSSVLKAVATRHWPWQVVGLIRDRAHVSKQSNAPRQRRAERQTLIDDFQQRLQGKLDGAPFLFGEQPTVADFAAYHMVWFADLTRPNTFLSKESAAGNWQTRMASFGHGNVSRTTRRAVFNEATRSEPRPIEASMQRHEHIGKTVLIKPNDYAQDSTSGTLVGGDGERWVIQRDTEQFGRLNIHFPQRGYTLTLDH